MKKIILTTTGIATGALAMWLVLSSFMPLIAGDDPVTPRTEIRAYVKEHILPAIKAQREKLNSYLSAEEIKKIEELQAGQTALREERMELFKSRQANLPKRDGTGPQFTPEQKEMMRAHMMKREKIRAEAYPIAASHQKEIYALIDEMDNMRAEWRTYMHDVFTKYREERGSGKPGQWPGPGMVPGKGAGMGPQGMHGKPGQGLGKGGPRGGAGPCTMSGRGRNGFGFMQINDPVQFLLFDPDQMEQMLEKSPGAMGMFYPNPAGDIINIRLQVEKAGPVSINLYDNQGNQLATILQKNKEAGTYTLEYNISNLKPGVYFYNITIGDQVIKRRFVKG
jgi:hypothetical protein